jgi:hypothetical protein
LNEKNTPDYFSYFATIILILPASCSLFKNL